MWEPPKASHRAVGGAWSSEFYTYTHHHWRYSGSTTYTDKRPRESDPHLVRSQIHRRTQRGRPVLHTPIHLQPDPDKLTRAAGHTHSCTHPVVPGHTPKAALTHTHSHVRKPTLRCAATPETPIITPRTAASRGLGHAEQAEGHTAPHRQTCHQHINYMHRFC